MSDDQQVGQSGEDGVIHVVLTDDGVRWKVCHGGQCLIDTSGARLMARYEALLIALGQRVPPG